MTGPSDLNPSPAPPDWHKILREGVRLLLAPLLLFFAGFFTANFIISGHYTWPRTSRTLALTLTVLILSYEFIYKEQLAQGATTDRARRIVMHSCVIPYVIGLLLMVALWKL